MTSFLPVCLLVLVAIGQIAAATFAGLTPWKGGGFGMFASTDRAESRFLVVTAKDVNGRAWRVAIPNSPSPETGLSEEMIGTTRAWPTPARLNNIAAAVATWRFQKVRTEIEIPANLRATDYGALLTKVELLPSLEYGGRGGSGKATLDIVEVSATVLRPVIDRANDSVALQPVTPPVAARVKRF